MPQDISLRFPNSLIPGINLKKYGEDERPSHGAPCTIQILGSEGDSKVPVDLYWGVARHVTNNLNTVPDNVNLRREEVKHGDIGTDTFGMDFRNKHVLATGGYIDTIAPRDLATVADKLMRDLCAMGFVTPGDYKSALMEMSGHGLVPQQYDGPHRLEGRERHVGSAGQYYKLEAGKLTNAVPA